MRSAELGRFSGGIRGNLSLAEGMPALAPQPDSSTTMWRLLHDAKRGYWVDTFAGRILIQTREDKLPPALVEQLQRHGGNCFYWKPRTAAANSEPTWVAGDRQNEPFVARENGLDFEISFQSGYSSGIFLDQRVNRRQVIERVSAQAAGSGDSPSVLNLFAYTAAFSVAAASAGAITTTCDLSGRYLDWGWRNFQLNGLVPDDHHGCKGDAFQWLKTFARQGRQFDGVILDPPTFSRNKKASFRTDRDYAELAQAAARLVKPGGWLLCCANTHRYPLRDYQRDVEQGIRRAGHQGFRLRSSPMPPEYNGDDYLKSLWIDFSPTPSEEGRNS